MIEIVKNNKKYWEFIRKLRNENDGFTEIVSISTKQQSNYMKKYNDNYLICLVDKNPVGYVGEIDGDIRVATHSSYKKQGLGKLMIDKLIENKPGAFAKVNINNKASLKLFIKCGFNIKYYILEKDKNELTN